MDGLDAIEHFRKIKPEVIVLDASIPAMNGPDAAPVLHDMAPQAPIILFTLHKDVVSGKHATAVGIRAVVSKMDQLEVLVDQILRLTHMIRAPTH
jgi:DNA-binding NarL/FixJ family response regulator